MAKMTNFDRRKAMPTAFHDRPQCADVITTYANLERFVSAFADGKIDNTVLIVGAPGLQEEPARRRRSGKPCPYDQRTDNTIRALP